MTPMKPSTPSTPLTTMSTTLPHAVDRTIVIRATPETVFRFFTDSARWAAWWGAGSTIDPKRGGALRIRYPDGTEAAGEVLEVSTPHRIVFSYGFVSGKPIPPGGSRVEVRLEPHAEGTRLQLTHQFAEAGLLDEFVQGWRYQLSLFANVVANEVNAGAADAVDTWFKAWAVADEHEREQVLRGIAAPTVQFRDRFSLVDGLQDLMPHISAAQRFMPGIRLERKGAIRHCQGAVLADWTAVSGDGQPRASGTNLFLFGVDGRITSVTGFWNT